MRCDSFFSLGRVLTLGLLIHLFNHMLLFAAPPEKDTTTRKPNILVIVADDLGYADLGCQGCKDIATPHIDSLAKNGIRFTSGYVSCPVCSPTRAGLMTGRYQQRFGHEFNSGPESKAPENFGLPLTEVTIADRLKTTGYATGAVGKWHLGYKEPFHPQHRGFDDFFGFRGGSHWYLKGNNKAAIMRGTKEVDEKEYLTDAFTREAVAFIDHHREEPFFLYLAFNAVHSPLQAPPKYQERVAKIEDEKRRTFGAMLTALDDGVGAVLAKLREVGVEENTLIFFISDNGGPTQGTTSRNDPLRGGKASVWEGGIRVPFLMQWKGHLPADKVYDKPVIALDVLPTAVAAAGGKLPENAKLDGVDLIPYLTGQNDKPPHELLFWRFGEHLAARKANWKIVKGNSPSPMLFDLDADIGEQKDLAAEQPDRLKELEADLKQWDSQLVKPLWTTPREK